MLSFRNHGRRHTTANCSSEITSIFSLFGSMIHHLKNGLLGITLHYLLLRRCFLSRLSVKDNWEISLPAPVPLDPAQHQSHNKSHWEPTPGLSHELWPTLFFFCFTFSYYGKRGHAIPKTMQEKPVNTIRILTLQPKLTRHLLKLWSLYSVSSTP